MFQQLFPLKPTETMVLLHQQNHKAMKNSMLDYCKLILEKVHFDPTLFRKEYYKSLKKLPEDEREHLQQWMARKFGQQTISVS